MRIGVEEIIWYILNLYEGWYSKDPTDKGGETFRGISRVSHPEWDGWHIIDSIKHKRDFIEVAKKSKILRDYVVGFYEKEYWKAMNLYALPIEVSTELFEQAINFGKKRAAYHLQTAVNVLSYGVYNEGLKVDGIIGNHTIDGTNRVDKIKLIKVLNSLQGCRYVELIMKNPSYRKYIGWFNRVDFSLYEKIGEDYERMG